MQLPAPTREEVDEASAVVGQMSGHQFELQLGHLCNNRCVFCVSGHLTALGMAKPIDLQPIVDAIDDARAGGATRLVFVGGEPTLHKGFLPALEHASKLGFSEIVIFTNGVKLPQPGFIDACLALGTFTWRISIQGATEEAHVAVTKKARSFQRILEGIRILRDRGQRVTCNMCVNEESYRSLPHYPELVSEYEIKQLHVDIVRPRSAGDTSPEYLRKIMPRYSEMAPYYDAMLRGFDDMDPDFDINVGNLPYCILPQWAHRVHHAGEATITKSAGADGFQLEYDKYESHRAQRTHLPGCDQCALRPSCTGVFHEYLELYGSEEFGPVSLSKLRELDPDMNSFTSLAAPLVRPLWSEPAPGGWRVAEHFADARSRRIELRFAHQSRRASVTVYVAPPIGVGREVELPEAVFTTDRYRVAVAVGGWLPAPELSELLGWVCGRLGSHPDVNVVQPLDEAAVTAAAGEDPALGRSRARMLRMVRQLQTVGRFAGWRYGGTRTRVDGSGADVSVVGPEGMGVTLAIDIAAAEGRSKVDAHFSLNDGTTQEAAAAAVDAIVAALRAAEPPRPRAAVG
ncbi:MAG: radical SAM protein [Myxococcales bacterium]|nr:radical SAM protein [Myxococcales bacterium]